MDNCTFNSFSIPKYFYLSTALFVFSLNSGAFRNPLRTFDLITHLSAPCFCWQFFAGKDIEDKFSGVTWCIWRKLSAAGYKTKDFFCHISLMRWITSTAWSDRHPKHWNKATIIKTTDASSVFLRPLVNLEIVQEYIRRYDLRKAENFPGFGTILEQVG